MMTTSRPVDWSLEQWPIQAVATAIRHEIDDEKIAALVASVRNGGELPPIFVLVDGGRTIILDGHHRGAAWVMLGYKTVPVLVGRPK